MSQLLLPVALWAGPPPHSVTSILILTNNKIKTGDSILVTGSSSGQLCIWMFDREKPNKEGGLLPTIFCLGHSAPITALVNCSYEDSDAFISVSTDGVLHMWRAQDGKCMKGMQFTAFHPLVLACMPDAHRTIAIAGCHSDIELIDAWTMTPRGSLRGHQDWVTALATTITNNEAILVSASRDGLVHFWAPSTSEESPLRTVCVDPGPMMSINPIGIVVAPEARTFVLVTPRAWMMYTAQSLVFLCAVECPTGDEWLGAKFLDQETLLVWTSNALTATYRLNIPASAESLTITSPMGDRVPVIEVGPTTKTVTHVKPGSAFIPIVSPAYLEASALASAPNLIYTINEFPPTPPTPTPLSASPATSSPRHSSSPSPPLASPRTMADSSMVEQIDIRKSSVNSFSHTTSHRYASSFSHFAACDGNYFAVGDTFGQVGVWLVRSDGCSSLCSGRVSDGWKTDTQAKHVTASLVLEDSLILIRGHENGQISTSALPTDTFPKFFKAHAARVNCLLCSPVLSSAYSSSNNVSGSSMPRRQLISGSDDFTIKVWDLPVFDLIHTFAHHTGPISWLFPPTAHQHNRSGEDWDNTFCAVSEDKCVGMYSLDSMRCLNLFGVHPALISSVKSKREQGYLVVECVDGSVAVWEKVSGQLEGIVYGQVAREISECSDIIWSSYNHPGTRSITNTAIIEPGGAESGACTSYSHGVGVQVAIIPTLLHRSPIQVLYLDVKQIIRELYQLLPQPTTLAPVPSSSVVSAVTSPPVAAKHNSSSNLNAVNPSANSGVAPLRARQSFQIGSSGVNPNSLPAFQIFSYLIPWGVDKNMDTLCKRETLLRPPNPSFAFGMKGDGGNLSIFVPAASEAGRWKQLPELSGIVTLAAVSLSKALLNLCDAKNSCIQVLTYYSTLLPEILGPQLVDSLLLLASYWLDPLEDIMSASRSVLFAAIDRLPVEIRKDLTQSLAMKLKQTTENHSRGLLAVVLGIVGSERPEALDEFAANTTAIELLKILYKGGTGPFTQVAVELLGVGFATWRPHVRDVTRLIRAFYLLSFQQDSLGQTAHHSLLLIGAQDPKRFLACIGAEILRDTTNSNNVHNAAAAVMVLGAMVKKDASSQLSQLPRLVEVVIKSLDPHVPTLRDACLKAATAVLHVMVTKYPMVSFHHDTQKLAVGSTDNVIIIYDLKTASRWLVLEGHKHSVEAVAFNDNGKVLASYSVNDSMVRIWQTGTSFFGILGSRPPCLKQFIVGKSQKLVSPQTLLVSLRLQWASLTLLTLVTTWDADHPTASFALEDIL